jgi:hypothetical protein
MIRVLRTKNFRKKLTTEKKNIFWIKNCYLLTLGLHEGNPSYKRSLQPSKENIQSFKKYIISLLYLLLVIQSLNKNN